MKRIVLGLCLIAVAISVLFFAKALIGFKHPRIDCEERGGYYVLQDNGRRGCIFW